MSVQQEDKLIEELKLLIFEKEKNEQAKLRSEVDGFKELLASHEQFKSIADPIIDERISQLKKEFPETFGSIIAATIKQQISDSQDEMVNALYPIMGQMVKKYIKSEFELLSARINKQLKQTVSASHWKSKIKSMFSGAKESDIALTQISIAEIEEIFVVQKGSGLVIGSLSSKDEMDQTMIAGMLTAIKSFSEDAFKKEGQNLEKIAYETYDIILHNSHFYYIAVVVNGAINEVFQDKLEDTLLNFTRNNLNKNFEQIDDTINQEISKKLKQEFNEWESNN